MTDTRGQREAAASRTLTLMLDRLLASMASGPAMNCRPQNSRQRIDFAWLSRFDDVDPSLGLRQLLGKEAKLTVLAKRPAPRRGRDARGRIRIDDPALSDEDRAAAKAYLEQQNLLGKLRVIADDARTYEQDTGVAVLYVGYPLLSLPPGSFGGGRGATRRITAPIALLPVNIALRMGVKPGIDLECRGDGVDFVLPNEALLAWIEQQTGVSSEDIFADEEGANPWREIVELVKWVAQRLDLSPPPIFETPELPESLALEAAPRGDEGSERGVIVNSAVLGLFPLANQGLLRDTQKMIEEPLEGPVRAFLSADAKLDDEELPRGKRSFTDERFVTLADPFQSRAVRMARRCRGLVVHGPPGTGKSQTIANIIGDHLARGQRVLFVCDKRTALDVVANRLDHLGIGQLCAVVHDPQRDQRDLYRSIREQLDGLTEQKTDPKVDGKLARVDEELARLHAELTGIHHALMGRTGESPSFHEMVGQWLAIRADAPVKPEEIAGVTAADLATHDLSLRELFARAAELDWQNNPWRDAAGLTLAELLSRPVEPIRSGSDELVRLAATADATRDDSIPAFAPEPGLREQSDFRAALLVKLRELKQTDADALRAWSKRDLPAGQSMAQKLAEARPLIEHLRAQPLDNELSLTAATKPLDLPTLNRHILALEGYLAIADRWYSVVKFSAKNQAREALQPYGLPLNADSARRLHAFLGGLRARLSLRLLLDQLDGKPSDPSSAARSVLGSDELLTRSFAAHEQIAALFDWLATQPSATTLLTRVADWLRDPTTNEPLLVGLDRSAQRAAALVALEEAMSKASLFDKTWLVALATRLRRGEQAAPILRSLDEKLDTLESVLRARETLATMPESLRQPVSKLLGSPDGIATIDAIRKAVLAKEISHRLANDRALQSVDGQRVSAAFARIAELDKQKRELVRDQVLFRWVSLQQARLLADNGQRLNSLGADTKRRLLLRGAKALRLRQVVALGAKIDGGDPLFDLRPVWMASPETVAQVFPRKPVFDVVVFDEASQCRLEEALPVLTRGHRVVIAGDPKQLPPTRFFESAVASSEEDHVETEQDLFELQQGSVEDLLGAALNLSIRQSYLDVHYRSRSADLIAFSNRHFYGSRLQPVPGHPSRRPSEPPIALYEVGGTYEDRANEAEADKVVEIVADLLSKPKPPSIGIACFNLVQRDLIIERLDEKADEDETFARRLAEARERSGAGSFEGLFVKNLENVQGDERDHIIISTTYGPDANGKFRRTFGPLGQAGGGRRLNVLVTRARERVHVVTSIPSSVYRALPPVPDGAAPGGAWLLFAYLGFAADLQAEYATRAPATSENPAPTAKITTLPTRQPSTFVSALADHLAAKLPLSGQAYWGGEGFGIDLALHRADASEEASVGVLCDLTRFDGIDDPIEWDLFRSGIHQSQGWTLHRVWSTRFFRDPPAVDRELLNILKTVETKPK
jgi:hypothetical protein